jgi:hypothetical protein
MKTTKELNNGKLEKILDPVSFFSNNKKEFLETVNVVRAAFGTEMSEKDIYNHLVIPEQVYLMIDDEGIFGMCSYSTKNIDNYQILFVEGIAIDPKKQGCGLFEKATNIAITNEEYIGLKTQSPRMYRALEKFCDEIYPNKKMDFSQEADYLISKLSENMNLDVDEKKVARGIYGAALYTQPQLHKEASELFDGILKVDYNKGDSVLCLGKIQ